MGNMLDCVHFAIQDGIGFWFQKGLSFPKITFLQKIWTKIHSNPDWYCDITLAEGYYKNVDMLTFRRESSRALP